MSCFQNIRRGRAIVHRFVGSFLNLFVRTSASVARSNVINHSNKCHFSNFSRYLTYIITAALSVGNTIKCVTLSTRACIIYSRSCVTRSSKIAPMWAQHDIPNTFGGNNILMSLSACQREVSLRRLWSFNSFKLKYDVHIHRWASSTEPKLYLSYLVTMTGVNFVIYLPKADETSL